MSLPQEAETTRKKLAAQEERIKLLVQTDKGHKFVVFSKPSVTVRQLRRTCELMGQKLYCTLYEEFVVTRIQGPVPPPTPSLSLSVCVLFVRASLFLLSSFSCCFSLVSSPPAWRREEPL